MYFLACCRTKNEEKGTKVEQRRNDDVIDKNGATKLCTDTLLQESSDNSLDNNESEKVMKEEERDTLISRKTEEKIHSRNISRLMTS